MTRTESLECSVQAFNASHSVLLVKCEVEDQVVHIEWQDSAQQQICNLTFDWAWLRDNCRCVLCADPFSHQRLITGGEPLDAVPLSV